MGEPGPRPGGEPRAHALPRRRRRSARADARWWQWTAGCPTTCDRCSTTPGSRWRRRARATRPVRRARSRWSASTASRATCWPRTSSCPAAPVAGDLLAFAATGAYTYSMASAYNRVGRPAVVGVRDGRADARGSGARTRRTSIGSRRWRIGAAAATHVAARRAWSFVPPPARGRPLLPGRSGPRSWPRVGTCAASGCRNRCASTGAGSGGPGPTARRRSWRSSGAASSGTSSSSANPTPSPRHVATLGIAVAADHRGKGRRHRP